MIIAHRGVHDNKKVPENSLEAFKLAIKNDYAIEFDIQITKDNKLVIFHDDNIERMTGINRNIQEMDFIEVKKLKLLDTKYYVPTFREVLDLVDGKVLLDIEIKSTKKVELVSKLVLEELEKYNGELMIKSFNPFIVKCLKKLTNKYKIGLLIMKKSPNKKLNFLVNSKLIYLFKFDFLSANKRMFNNDFYNKHKNKYPLYAWTFNGTEEINNFLEKYPDVVCISNKLM